MRSSWSSTRAALSGFGGGGLQPWRRCWNCCDRIRGERDCERPVYLIIDDYGLAAPALAPLAEVLPHAHDIGLHVAVARQRGAARALYDPGARRCGNPGRWACKLSAAPE